MGEQFKAMIVQDPAVQCAEFVFLLESHPSIDVRMQVETIEESLSALSEESYDVLFIDVKFRNGSGFDILYAVPNTTNVIFLAETTQYAAKAFDVNAMDYLLKPVSLERLEVTIERLTEKKAIEHRYALACEQKAKSPHKKDVIVLQCDDCKRFISIEQIVAVLSEGGNYTSVNLGGNVSYTVRKSFKAWETVLPKSIFFRVHRQGIANMTYASSLRKRNEGVWELEMQNINKPLQVSRRALPHMQRFLKKK